jgi:hypothetical protein
LTGCPRPANDQGDRGHDPEIADRLDGQPPDPLEVVAMTGDADHQGPEDDRDHDRLDHAEKGGRERLEAECEVLRRQPADQNTGGHADKDPTGEGDTANGRKHEKKGANG